MKASVYIETSVFSYLTARPSNDLRAMANQSATSEWWETQRPNYSVFVSDLVISEAGKGHIEAAQRRLSAIADLSLNLFKTCIEAPTLALKAKKPWVISVLWDNAGAARFDDDHYYVITGETHSQVLFYNVRKG